MPEFPETNPSLIARVQDLGDGASWEEFLGIYQPVVFRMARKRGLQDADAHDVIQQVFFSISRSIQNWKPDESQPPFRAWLTTIAHNAITKSFTRRPRDTATGSSSVAELLDQQPDPLATESEILAEARKEVIHWAVTQIRAEFSEETWAIFEQTAIQGIPIPEVAQTMGRSPGSIYVTRYRIMARLKEKTQEISHHWDLVGPSRNSIKNRVPSDSQELPS